MSGFFISKSTDKPSLRELEASDNKKRWMNRLIFAALIFALTWGIVYPFISSFPAYDFDVFLTAARGDLTDYYYAPWLIPFFKIFTIFSYEMAWVVGNVINIACFLYAVHVFRGNKILFLTSFSLMASIFYGQMDGIFALGLAGMFVGLQRKNILLVSLAWMLAGAKFYIGIPLGIGLIWCYGHSIAIRAKVGLLTLFLIFISFIIWQNWVPDLLLRMQETPPHNLYSIDTWGLVGPVVLLLWVPVFLSRTHNYLWWVATWALTVPYLHIHGMNQLMIMPIGPVGWVMQINYIIGFNQAYFLMIIPLWIYIKGWWNSWRTDWLSYAILYSSNHQSRPLGAKQEWDSFGRQYQPEQTIE